MLAVHQSIMLSRYLPAPQNGLTSAGAGAWRFLITDYLTIVLSRRILSLLWPYAPTNAPRAADGSHAILLRS